MSFNNPYCRRTAIHKCPKAAMGSSLILLSFFIMISCEDVIEIKAEDAASELVVDAWLNNKSEIQTIRMNRSQNYFDNSDPPPETGASVKISNRDGNTFIFQDINNNGFYSWTPLSGQSLGEIGDIFTLSIEINSEIYSASTELFRVPILDSLVQEFKENEIFLDDGIYVEFFARDFPGTGDSYWIKSFKNGNFLNKATELNIAYDAGFDSGSQIDGLIFIPPIREFVNEHGDNQIDIPWNPGDISKVEIHSISNEAFNFLEIARDQINNGNNGIFSIPFANTRSNIFNVQSGAQVLGFFNVSAVSEKELLIR